MVRPFQTRFRELPDSFNPNGWGIFEANGFIAKCNWSYDYFRFADNAANSASIAA